MIRALLALVLSIPVYASAACSASSINTRALLTEARPLLAAGVAIRQAGKSSPSDFGNSIEIARYSREIFSETNWFISLLQLHSEMVDKSDRAAVNEVFKSKIEGFVNEIDSTIADINETSGQLKSAGVAAHVPVITERMRTIQKLLAACR